ncbi:hypothetical protein ACHAXR_003908, partial [Thalassiosira sp. AJA248-18]
KTKTPFCPNSPTSVGSPKDDGSRFYLRSVRQRTPQKLCSLVLPPPLISLFDNSGGTDTTARFTASSDNASLDGGGHSIMDASSTPVRYSSNASAVSASVASVGGIGSSGSSVVHPHLPLHLRVGLAPCDPLIVFHGRFVLVGTCDGRIAIYSMVDFDQGGISEDVKASERRRRAEWKDADDKMKGEEKKDETKTQMVSQDCSIDIANEPLLDTNEESEWDMRDRMHRREKAKQTVDPILIVTLPKVNHGSEDDQNKMNHCNPDEEISSVNVGGTAAPPTIVAMCATPSHMGTLIEQRDAANSSSSPISKDQTKASNISSQSHVPATFGKDLLGHVAVLTDDGEVHVLEFLQAPVLLNDTQESEGGCSNNEMIENHIPIVNFVLSFRTGHLVATCICMHQLSTAESLHHAQQPRLCIGHQSGILAAFQIYSTYIYPGVRGVHSSLQGEHTKADTFDETTAQIKRHEKQTPPSSASPRTRSKSTDFHDMGLSNAQTSPRKASANVLQRSTVDNTNNIENVPLYRTLSEPIAAADIDKRELASVVGPAKVVLCWKGKFDVPIRSISSPGWGRPSDEKAEKLMEDALLVVGLEHRQREDGQNSMNAMAPSVPHYSLSPSLSLEMINATLAEKYWCRIRPGSDPSKYISLYDCSVWPAAGKEIKDGWIRGAPLTRGIDPRDKLFGTLGLQRSSITNHITIWSLLGCFERPDSCFVSASSDGTVAISHYQQERGSWGVMEEDNQIMLFQRCIGTGTFDYGDIVSGARRYAVCCLRGGTIYLIPVAENDTTRALGGNEITMFAVPMDPNGDDDGLLRFVQNFTAGMVQVLCWKDQLGPDKSHMMCTVKPDGTTKSVALVGWPGGIIDVYELNPERRRDTNVLLGEIVERG